MNRGGDIDNLPPEIISEILSRLPVKSLIHFRLVSKSWNAIIIHPHFLKKHLNQATKLNNLSQKKAILCLSSSSKLFSSPLSSTNSTELIVSTNITRTGQIKFLGSCNGLFCIFIARELFLWNPSTRKSRKLPNPPIPLPISIHNIFSSFAVSAFGYDSCIDDYKVMRNVWSGPNRYETLLYSLKKDSWTVIEDNSPYRIDYQVSGIFVKRAFHWLVNHGPYSKHSYAIVSFGLESERYGTLPLPADESLLIKSIDQKLNITVLKGWLCLYCNYFRRAFVLWAMKDYGEENSWATLLKFEYDNVFSSIFPLRSSYVHVVPKYLFENGEMLVEVKGIRHGRVEVVRYRENEMPVRVFGGISDLGEIHVYLETLVSPLCI